VLTGVVILTPVKADILPKFHQPYSKAKVKVKLEAATSEESANL
jgi:hypothetical protein